MFINFPKDPVMLLSVVNTKLRDHYPTLEALCEDLHVSKDDLTETLQSIDYEYDTNKNQFV